jgi:Uma2 family endonuclease
MGWERTREENLMASSTAAKLLTAEEFFDWTHRPENRDRHFELERGEVVEMSRPGERHGVVCGNAGYMLNGYTRRRGKGYVCINDTGLILERNPDTVRGPDIALYDEIRHYDQLNLGYSAQPPKLAVEVLSPNDRWGKVTARINKFLEAGISLVWLVDPDGRSVTVYRKGELPRVLEEGDVVTGSDILPDLHCPVAEFFFMPGEESIPAEGGGEHPAQG